MCWRYIEELLVHWLVFGGLRVLEIEKLGVVSVDLNWLSAVVHSLSVNGSALRLWIANMHI